MKEGRMRNITSIRSILVHVLYMYIYNHVHTNCST